MRFLAAFVALTLSAMAHGTEAPLDPTTSTLKFTGHTLLHDFNGEAREFHGSAQVDPASPAFLQNGEVVIASAKLTTFINARDRKMFEWLHVKTKPEIHFQLGKIKLIGGDALHATKAAPAQFAVSGTFTLNKVDKPLKTEVSFYRDGQHLIADGKARIDTSDHGLPEIKTLFMAVDKNVDITFHLVFDLPK